MTKQTIEVHLAGTVVAPDVKGALGEELMTKLEQMHAEMSDRMARIEASQVRALLAIGKLSPVTPKVD